MAAERAEGSGDRLSILHVVPYFPPDRIGGVGEAVAHVHEALLRAGHASTVLTSGTTRDDVTVVRVGATPDAFVFQCARRISLARRADVINIHHGEGLGLLLAMRAFRVRRPILLTLHVDVKELRRAMRPVRVEGRTLGAAGGRGLLRRIMDMRAREWLDRGALALADRVVFISRSTALDVLGPEQGASARVVYNGVSAPRTDGRGARALEPEPVELLYVGAHNARKRVELLPLVLARVRARRPQVRLRVIGFGAEDHPGFVRLAREVGVLDGIVFEGRKLSEELAPFYHASRMLLVPSAYEGLPMVILEAYRCGLPCVATRVSGHPEVIEPGRTGLLVAPDQPQEMAEAVLQMLDQPDVAHRMGERGRTLVETRFTVERQVGEYLELYHALRAGTRDAEIE